MAKHLYAPSTSGFYIEGLHMVIPEDAFEITEEFHQELINGQSNGKVISYAGKKLKLVDFTPPPMTWERIRSRRDYLLVDCDWTQVLDNGLTDDVRAAWKTYRQALRDITTAFTAAADVVWPLAPGTEPATKEA